MGRIFSLPPSTFEVDHWRSILAAERYQDAHDGALPQTLAWHRLERRYDLNPMRFSRWHPNVSLLIERSRQDHEDGPGRPDMPPLDRCSPYEYECGCEQSPPHGGSGEQNVVPEPPALVSMGAAIVVWYAAFLWLRKTAKKSVVEG